MNRCFEGFAKLRSGTQDTEVRRSPSHCFRPILLKKSTLVSTVEKYALEIEIFTLSRGFRAQISRSGAQKRRFQRSLCGQSGRTDFFNGIGQKQPFGQRQSLQPVNVHYGQSISTLSSGRRPALQPRVVRARHPGPEAQACFKAPSNAGVNPDNSSLRTKSPRRCCL